MIIDKLLTRKGWRVVAHSMLVGAGIGLLYFLSTMVTKNMQHEYTINWGILGIAIVISLWLVALGSMLIKAELTNWR
jgi:hypothetical protein